jgi:hypothetical protein
MFDFMVMKCMELWGRVKGRGFGMVHVFASLDMDRMIPGIMPFDILIVISNPISVN